jgi:hypothetical protein
MQWRGRALCVIAMGTCHKDADVLRCMVDAMGGCAAQQGADRGRRHAPAVNTVQRSSMKAGGARCEDYRCEEARCEEAR